MQALRFIAEPSNSRLVIDLPSGLDHGRLEVIVMPAPDVTDVVQRTVPATLRGSVTMNDDLVAPLPEDDWDALK